MTDAENELSGRPPGGIDDLFVHTGYDHRTGCGVLRVETAARLAVPELGLADVPAAGPHPIDGVEPWSAERPRLYRGTVHTGQESAGWSTSATWRRTGSARSAGGETRATTRAGARRS